MPTYHVYLSFRLLGGRTTEETERLNAPTPAAALRVAAARWPLLDAAGTQCRQPIGYQVWRWDGESEVLELFHGVGEIMFA